MSAPGIAACALYRGINLSDMSGQVRSSDRGLLSGGLNRLFEDVSRDLDEMIRRGARRQQIVRVDRVLGGNETFTALLTDPDGSILQQIQLPTPAELVSHTLQLDMPTAVDTCSIYSHADILTVAAAFLPPFRAVMSRKAE